MLYRSDGSALRYQAVRFKRPALSTRRLITLGLYTGIVYATLQLVWQQFDIEIEFVEDTEQQQQQQQQQGQQHPDLSDEHITEEIEGPLYASEDSTFIPLTWSTKQPRTFYRGSDPEWQEFIRIARDTTLHKKIQDELVQIVYTGCTSHPTISRQLGSNLQVGKYWLDISFPDGPPQEYERKGIEIGDGFVAWSVQRLDAEKQWRVERALVPRAAAEGVWRTVSVLAGMNWRRVKQRLGFEGPDGGSPEERYRVALEMQQRQQSGSGSGSGGREVGKAQTDPDVASAPPSSSAAAGTTQQPPPSRQQPSEAQTTRKDLPWHIPTIRLPTSTSNPFSSLSSSPTNNNNNNNTSTATPTPPSDLPIALHVFSASLSKNWHPKKSEPPRGAFIVQGLVEVRGSKGRMLFDVSSAYDPKGAKDEKGAGGGGKFVNVNAGVRGYKRWRQSPRGGP